MTVPARTFRISQPDKEPVHEMRGDERRETMKVFVATAETQGTRATDFDNCIDGELVWMLDPCPESERNPDGPCGCGRSFSGMNSHESTTTSVVREIPELTVGTYTAALRASFEAQGWCSCCTAQNPEEMIAELVDLASKWPEGSVVERRLDWLNVRELTHG